MTTRSRDTQPTFRAPSDPLDQQSLGAIISGQHGAPFDVLGPHRLEIDGQPDGSLWIVRAFVPGAEAVSVDLSPYPLPASGTGREASVVREPSEGPDRDASGTKTAAGDTPSSKLQNQPQSSLRAAKSRKDQQGSIPLRNAASSLASFAVPPSGDPLRELIPMRLLHPAGLWSAIVLQAVLPDVLTGAGGRSAAPTATW